MTFLVGRLSGVEGAGLESGNRNDMVTKVTRANREFDKIFQVGLVKWYKQADSSNLSDTEEALR